MEELKETEYSTNSIQNTDSIEINIVLIDDKEQKNSQVALIDEAENNPQSTLPDETEKNPQEVAIDTPSKSIEIKTEDANTTNCLALTIQEDHKLVAFKNVFLRSIRMSWKVVVSTITLALIKLFS